jgi:hypothetical protein
LDEQINQIKTWREINMNLTEALTLEHNMWKTAQNRDAEKFLEIVSPQAVMICGGFR